MVMHVAPSASSDDQETATVRRWLQLTDARKGTPIEHPGEEFTTCGELALDNQVACILLNVINGRLPNWGYTRDDGEYICTRKTVAVRSRRVQLLPQLLLSINWASSGPGFSWPVSYYVTYVPGLNVRVVTESRDCEEITGYTDLAIGWCKVARHTAWGCKRIIVEYWLRAHGVEPIPWECVWREGLISKEQAMRWRTEVWGTGPDWCFRGWRRPQSMRMTRQIRELIDHVVEQSRPLFQHCSRPGWALYSFRGEVERYVTRFVDEHSRLPEGRHSLGVRDVIFPSIRQAT